MGDEATEQVDGRKVTSCSMFEIDRYYCIKAVNQFAVFFSTGYNSSYDRNNFWNDNFRKFVTKGSEDKEDYFLASYKKNVIA